jgi:hypothetical protein
MRAGRDHLGNSRLAWGAAGKRLVQRPPRCRFTVGAQGEVIDTNFAVLFVP